MAGECSHTRTGDQSLYTSEVTLYNGTTLPPVIIAALLNPTAPPLNDVIAAISLVVDTINSTLPTTTLPTASITLSDVLTGIVPEASGTDLQTVLEDVVAQMTTDNTTLGGKVDKSLFDANSILFATVDNTPLALAVPINTVIGRGAGAITTLTAANLTTLLNGVERNATNLCIQPINTTDTFAVGEAGTADKLFMVIKEGAIWADNPYLAWNHNVISTYDGVVIQGAKADKLLLSLEADVDDCLIRIMSEGALSDLSDQTLMFGDQTGLIATLRNWNFLKDGADSRTFKLRYFNGAANTNILTFTVAGLMKLNSTTGVSSILDEDTMVSDSAVALCTQQSIKAYADTKCSQTEINTTQTGAGLDASGTYTADAATNYIVAADFVAAGLTASLKNADRLIDAEVYQRENHLVDGARKNVTMAVGTFVFSDHPTAGAHAIFGSTDIPDNAIIIDAWVDIITAFTDDGINTSTLGIGVNNVGAGTEDINNAAAIGTDYTISILTENTLDFDITAPIKTTAARDITVNVVLAGGAATLSTGKMRIYLTYLISD